MVAKGRGSAERALIGTITGTDQVRERWLLDQDLSVEAREAAVATGKSARVHRRQGYDEKLMADAKGFALVPVFLKDGCKMGAYGVGKQSFKHTKRPRARMCEFRLRLVDWNLLSELALSKVEAVPVSWWFWIVLGGYDLPIL